MRNRLLEWTPLATQTASSCKDSGFIGFVCDFFCWIPSFSALSTSLIYIFNDLLNHQGPMCTENKFKKTSLRTDVIFYTYRKDINKYKQTNKKIKTQNNNPPSFSLFGKQQIRQRSITRLAIQKQTKSKLRTLTCFPYCLHLMMFFIVIITSYIKIIKHKQVWRDIRAFRVQYESFQISDSLEIGSSREGQRRHIHTDQKHESALALSWMHHGAAQGAPSSFQRMGMGKGNMQPTLSWRKGVGIEDICLTTIKLLPFNQLTPEVNRGEQGLKGGRRKSQIHRTGYGWCFSSFLPSLSSPSFRVECSLAAVLHKNQTNLKLICI